MTVTPLRHHRAGTLICFKDMSGARYGELVNAVPGHRMVSGPDDATYLRVCLGSPDRSSRMGL